MIEVSGDYLEGGGSILRVATALSAYTGTPCKITNIRENRPKKGLLTQHLESIKGVSALCNGELKGAELGSVEIEFYPGNRFEKHIEIEIPTAGSVGLALYPILIAATGCKNEINITVKGGATNGKFAAPVDFIKYVLLPLLKKMEYKADIEIKKYGYYPKGGSLVKAVIHPSKICSITLLERGNLISVSGISQASSDLKKANVAERQKISADKELKKAGINPEIEVKYTESICTGSAIELIAKTDQSYLGANTLGELRKTAEDVGKEAAIALIQLLDSRSAIDEHIEDQILPFMAISAVETGIESNILAPKITNHTKTNIWVIEKFLPVKFSIENNIISCVKI